LAFAFAFAAGAFAGGLSPAGGTPVLSASGQFSAFDFDPSTLMSAPSEVASDGFLLI
jgi:hypothetical protein